MNLPVFFLAQRKAATRQTKDIRVVGCHARGLISNPPPAGNSLCLLVALGLLCANAAKADYNWNGNNIGKVGNMSYSDNWYSSTLPSFGLGGSLHFSYNGSGASESSIYDDLSYWPNVDNIYWDSTFGSLGSIPWNSGGNGFNFNQRLENDWVGTVVVNTPTSGNKNGAGHIELNPVGGALVLNTNVYNDNNSPFEVWGNSTNMLTVNCGLTGNSGVGFSIKQYSLVKFTAAQTWGGSSSLTVSNGELWVDSGGNLSVPMVNMNALAGYYNGISKFWLSTASGGSTVTNAITVNNGGTDVLGGLNTNGNNTFSGNITLNGPVQIVADNSNGVVTFSGNIGGNSNVVVAAGTSGNGTIALLGNNTFAGGTTIGSTTTLLFTNDVAFGAASGGINFTASGVIAATNNGAAANNSVTISSARTITVGSSVGANFATLDTNNLTVAAYITGAGGVTKKSSAYNLGTVRFSNDTNNYSGDFTAQYGNTEFTSITNQGSASSLGQGSASTGGTITLANGTSAGTLRYVGTNNSSTTRPLKWTATTGGYTLDVTNAGTIAFLNTTSNLVSGAGVKTLTLQGSNVGTNTLAQPIGDSTSGVTSVTKSGAGTWVLSGSNSFSGGLTLNSGVLDIGNTNALGAGTFTIGGNGSFDNTYSADITVANPLTMSGGSPTYVGSAHNMTINGSVTISGLASGQTRTVTVSGNTLTLGGNISDGGNNFGLTKAGAGTLTVSGVNAYMAGTTLSAGTLRVSTVDNNLGYGPITVSGSATLATASGGGARILTNAVTINAGQILSLDAGYANLTLNGAISGSGPLNIGNGDWAPLN